MPSTKVGATPDLISATLLTPSLATKHASNSGVSSFGKDDSSIPTICIAFLCAGVSQSACAGATAADCAADKSVTVPDTSSSEMVSGTKVPGIISATDGAAFVTSFANCTTSFLEGMLVYILIKLLITKPSAITPTKSNTPVKTDLFFIRWVNYSKLAIGDESYTIICHNSNMLMKNLTKSSSFNWIRFSAWASVILMTPLVLLFLFIIDTKNSVLIQNNSNVTPLPNNELPPLPIGVDPHTKTISENPAVDTYMSQYVASNHTKPKAADSWLERSINKLAELDWYQNLATPATRILVIQSGERHEEIARNFARILRWDENDKKIFTERLLDEVPSIYDGKLYPGRYVVMNDAGPEEVAVAVAERFNAEVRTRYGDDIAKTIPLKDALTIASLIEREAYDFNDMRYISGVIWNRLFTGMRLQIDATLQYAKGASSVAAGGKWWAVPKPEDKYIKSPYNTYQNDGLPPAPIANPSIDAIIAALNPRDTDCLFYYHTDDGTFYCNATYEEHIAGIKKHFGTKNAK